MLVSPPNPKVVATIVGVVVGAFGSILFNFFYYNLSSNYITEPYRWVLLIGWVYRYRIVNNKMYN